MRSDGTPSKVIILMGLPGSGKSHWAAQEAAKRPDQLTIVCKDALRAHLLTTGAWTPDREPGIIQEEERLIKGALAAGQDVIIDSTNFAHESRLRNIAVRRGASVEVKFFNTPVEECIARDALRDVKPITGHPPVGEQVIKAMAARYEDLITIHRMIPADNRAATGADAIIVDMDGTLALHPAGRSVHDHHLAANDDPNEVVVKLIERHWFSRIKIIILTAREEQFRHHTESFLLLHHIHWDQLYMRATHDPRKDLVIKYELFNAHIRDKFHILFCLDDRTRVVRMWRALGLPCLQVADGDF